MTSPASNPKPKTFVRLADDHWALFLAEGIVLIVLGILAVALAPFASVVFTMVLGWLFIMSGVAGLLSTFWVRPAPGFWWSLISGVLGLATGIVLLVWPASGAISLTLVLIVFFALEGAASIMYALDHRKALSGRWAWMLASGIVDLILAAIIFTGLPGAAFWIIGFLVGVNLVFGGVALIAMAVHMRALTQSGVIP